MMKQFYNYEKEKIKKKERKKRQKKKKEEEMKEVQPLVTAKEVAENIKKMKKKNQNSKDERSKYNKNVPNCTSLVVPWTNSEHTSSIKPTENRRGTTDQGLHE